VPTARELGSLGVDVLYVPERWTGLHRAKRLGFEVVAYIWTFKAASRLGVVGHGFGPRSWLGAGCPNNPLVRKKALRRIRSIARRRFDGVVLDGVRFPGPSSGLPLLATCLCRHCERFCKSHGYSFGAVRGVTEELSVRPQHALHGSRLLKLLRGQGEFEEFSTYRQRSITDFVQRCEGLATRVRVSLDAAVFSPSLAPLVGQDYAMLSESVDALQPMLYHKGRGPACINFELANLFRQASARDWARQLRAIFGRIVKPRDLDAMVKLGLADDVVKLEMARALRLIGKRTRLAPILLIVGSSPKHIGRLVSMAVSQGADEVIYFMYRGGMGTLLRRLEVQMRR